MAINQAFYRQLAGAFGASRNHPWPGWRRLLTHLGAQPQALSVLDVACGNGRFAEFLQAHYEGPVDYLGVDTSEELLSEARACKRPWARFERQDILHSLPEPSFALVGCFGLTHHVPGSARRKQLMQRLFSKVAPGGLLAVSFWRFAERPRFAKRVKDWSAYNAEQPPEHRVPIAQLEAGDHLVVWGRGEGLRYCHSFSEAEIDALFEEQPVIARFLADGKSQDLNEYVVLQRPAGPS